MKSNHKTKVKKASGELVEFDVTKLRHSLEKSGASETIITKILQEISDLLYEGITTKEIYSKAFSILRKSPAPIAARYKLKKAIYELGPSGFPFEKYVAEILKYEGFTTKVGVIVKGHCVNHEVDVVAEKGEKHFMVECKFHSDPGRNCDVKIPLYIQSRFLDVEAAWEKLKGHAAKYHQGWIVTNTRFTSDAIQYGKCSGLMLIGWDHPNRGSLKERINHSGLHPLTSLTTLSSAEKTRLLEKGFVLCMDLCKQPDLLKKAGIGPLRHQKILNEAQALCNLPINIKL